MGFVWKRLLYTKSARFFSFSIIKGRVCLSRNCLRGREDEDEGRRLRDQLGECVYRGFQTTIS